MIDILPMPMTLNDYTIRVATTEEEIAEYSRALEHAFIDRLDLKYFKASPDIARERSLYLVSFHGGKIVGGLRIIRPADKPFVFNKHLIPQEAIPDWQEMRRWGHIAELMGFFVDEEHKAKMDMSAMNQYFLATARMLGISHLICNSWLFTKATLLYGALGFYALTDVLQDTSARISEEDRTPNAMVMIGTTMPSIPMPPQAQKLSLPQLMQICRQYERA